MISPDWLAEVKGYLQRFHQAQLSLGLEAQGKTNQSSAEKISQAGQAESSADTTYGIRSCVSSDPSFSKLERVFHRVSPELHAIFWFNRDKLKF